MINQNTQTTPLGERGGVVIFTSLFMMTMIFLLVLSVDGHFLLQSKLEENNLTEYLGMAALANYRKMLHDGQVGEQGPSIVARSVFQSLKIIGEENSITGLHDWGWDFYEFDCTGISCKGDGWEMVLGQWNPNTTGESGIFINCDPNDPDVYDCINAVKVSLEYKKSSLITFFSPPGTNSDKVRSRSVSYFTSEELKVIRVANTFISGA